MANQSQTTHYVVTGGLGFIGGHVVEALLKTGESVSIVDSLSEIVYSAGERTKLLRRFEESGVIVSISDINDLDRLPLPDPIPDELRIINCAALPGQRYSWTNTKEYYRANTLSVVSLVNLLPNALPVRLIHISTSSIYGQNAVADEKAPADPISPYGHSKYAAEVLLEDLLKNRKDCSLTILRLFSIYGPRQRDDMALSRLIKAISSNTSFTIFGTGDQRRTPTYVGDVVDAIFSSMLKDTSRQASSIYNVGGTESLTLRDYITIIQSELDKTGTFVFENPEKGDQIETRSNSELIKAELGWNSKTSFREGIRAQISYGQSSDPLAHPPI